MSLKEFDYDVVIVGGGPAGSSAAFAAAKKGVKVAMLEKEETIAQSVRTSGVTWIKDVKKFGIPPECYNEIRNYSFCEPEIVTEGNFIAGTFACVVFKSIYFAET